jgi:hypothetical protein
MDDECTATALLAAVQGSIRTKETRRKDERMGEEGNGMSCRFVFICTVTK